MKKILIIVCIMVVSTAAFGQYKKASFFTKDGRVYELGAVSSFFSNNYGKPPLAIYYSNSIEADKKWSYFSDLEFMLKSKFTYTAAYRDPVLGTDVTGKVIADRGSAFAVKYGAQYRFVKANAERETLVPYLRLALAIAYDFGAKNPVNDKGVSVDPEPEINDAAAFLGLEGGAGISYYFTQSFGIRLGAGYRYGVTVANGFASANIYNSYRSHPLASISLKYKIFNSN